MSQKKMCLCHSGKTYSDCCKKYHLGSFPKDALCLMRSRYSAYALGLSDYIMQTTDPNSPSFSNDQKLWKKNILEFSKKITFQNLEILGFEEKGDVAFVSFIAFLMQDGMDVSFVEKSRFSKKERKWFYLDGKTMQPLPPREKLLEFGFIF